jgi:hypothetical protein
MGLMLQGVIFLLANEADNPHFELHRVVVIPAVAGEAERYSVERIKPNAHIVPREDVCVGELEASFRSSAIDTPTVPVPDDLRDQGVEAVNQIATGLGHRDRPHYHLLFTWNPRETAESLCMLVSFPIGHKSY